MSERALQDERRECRALSFQVAQQDRVLKRLHVSHFARAGTPQGIRSPSPRVRSQTGAHKD